MMTEINVNNFRSLESAHVALAPLTVLYGPTASGKSSLLYSALVLRNFILNPNQQADGLFNLGFMNLGGFDQCVFNHDPARLVSVFVTYDNGTGEASYGISFGKTEGTIELKSHTLAMKANVSIPYALNQSFPFDYAEKDEQYAVNWNGITCAVVPKTATVETQQKAQEIAASLNASSEVLRQIDIAPHRRGFFKPNYTPVAASPTPTSEDEVASIIINDPNMAARISVYSHEVFERDFRLYMAPGTATAFPQTTDKRSTIPVWLVNDGFGVNQVIYLLAKMCRVDVRTILIEEPEVHLHPTILRNFARVLCKFIVEEGKQILLATHSELFLVSILAAISERAIAADQVKCYLATKDKRATLLKDQKVSESGQIEGGLSSFVEAEYEDLRRFLGLK